MLYIIRINEYYDVNRWNLFICNWFPIKIHAKRSLLQKLFVRNQMISEQNDKTRMSALPLFFKSNAFETFHQS